MATLESTPQVSCVMAVNRDDGFLHEAISSVLAQQGVSFEFLIVANNCSDELWQCLQKWQDPRIRLFRTSIGQLPFNLNYAIDLARAPLIARMDADDICRPGRFLKQWQRFEANPRLDVLGTSYERIDDKGRITGTFSPPLTDVAIRRGMKRECQIVHPSVMFKRSTALRHRGYAYGFFGEDYDLWLRMRRDPNVVFENLPDFLISYRVHDAQMSSNSVAQKTFTDLFPLFLREFRITGEWGFLGGLLRRWFFSTGLWSFLRPIWRAVSKKGL